MMMTMMMMLSIRENKSRTCTRTDIGINIFCVSACMRRLKYNSAAYLRRVDDRARDLNRVGLCRHELHRYGVWLYVAGPLGASTLLFRWTACGRRRRCPLEVALGAASDRPPGPKASRLPNIPFGPTIRYVIIPAVVAAVYPRKLRKTARNFTPSPSRKKILLIVLSWFWRFRIAVYCLRLSMCVLSIYLFIIKIVHVKVFAMKMERYNGWCRINFVRHCA